MRAPERGPSGIVTTSTPRLASLRGAFERARRRVTARRHQLDGADEPAVHQLARERRLLFALRSPASRSAGCATGTTSSRRPPPLTRQPRRHRLRRQRDLPDMLRRRPATPADQAHTGGDEAPRIRRHVFRRTEIEIAALDVARLTGVRLRREPYIDDVGDALDSLEHRRGSDAAVNADDVGAALDQLRRELLRRRTVEAGAILFRGHLRDDRQVADAAHRGNGGADLVQVAEGFEDEEIDLAVEQRLRLIAKHRFRFVDAGLAPRLDAHAERADRAGDVGLALRLLDRLAAPASRRPD